MEKWNEYIMEKENADDRQTEEVPLQEQAESGKEDVEASEETKD